jgi:hypothetical protein
MLVNLTILQKNLSYKNLQEQKVREKKKCTLGEPWKVHIFITFAYVKLMISTTCKHNSSKQMNR